MRAIWKLLKFLFYVALFLAIIFGFMWVVGDSGKQQDAKCVAKFGQNWTAKGYTRGYSSPDCVEINGSGYGYL